MGKDYILSAQNISKTFPGVKALDNVQLNIERGRVHALMGENGAGKSTLMKILIGMYAPDAGEILFKGKSIKMTSTHDALKIGISMIHQELLPFPELIVAENIFMGKEPTQIFRGWINKKKLNEDARVLLEHLNIKLSASRKMKELSVAEMQMVEIAKAISNNSEVIIMDEPTSAISDREVETLFNIIRDLKNRGVAIIYISHKMDEIFQIADTVTVLRDGQYISTNDAHELDKGKLISLMVGRELNAVFHKEEIKKEEVVLSVQGLCKTNKFKDINFELRRGEIIGIAGLMGAGRTEVVSAIFGLAPADNGTIKINNKKVVIKSPKDAIKNGIALVSEDRKGLGLFLNLSVKRNITISNLKSCCKAFFINHTKESELVDGKIRKLSIKTPGRDQLVKNLSGGNQQKVVIAKALLTNPDILILDEPTRGIDVAAKSEVHRIMTHMAAEGKAIIMISSELPEILGMSDRILVMHNGIITGELDAKDATQREILRYAMAQ